MYKIGYTTGVFDLFHIGHLNILRRSKEQCEYLIVGVSTDDLVLEYKNKKPVIPFEERKQIIESIKYVDMVIPQETLDKVGAYLRLKFSVLFQRDDWKKSPMYNETIKQFKEMGIDLMCFPYMKETLSTELKQALKLIIKGGGVINDAIFVGNDWKGSPSWNNYEQDFKEIGVDVVYLLYTDGVSSTILKNKLNE